MIRNILFAALALLFFVSPAPARDAASVKADLARTYVGTFRWQGSTDDQKVTIAFDNVIDGAAGNVWAFGNGVYEIPERTTAIRVKCLIDPITLKLQMWELSPDKAGFVTDGVHEGSLSDDHKTIKAVWHTSGTDAQGDLMLTAP